MFKIGITSWQPWWNNLSRHHWCWASFRCRCASAILHSVRLCVWKSSDVDHSTQTSWMMAFPSLQKKPSLEDWGLSRSFGVRRCENVTETSITQRTTLKRQAVLNKQLFVDWFILWTFVRFPPCPRPRNEKSWNVPEKWFQDDFRLVNLFLCIPGSWGPVQSHYCW